MKPMLKVPMVSAEYDEPLSNFAFDLNVCRYNEAGRQGTPQPPVAAAAGAGSGASAVEVVVAGTHAQCLPRHRKSFILRNQTHGFFSPRHQTRFKPSFLLLNDIP
jgi:hypothetical protein